MFINKKSVVCNFQRSNRKRSEEWEIFVKVFFWAFDYAIFSHNFLWSINVFGFSGEKKKLFSWPNFPQLSRLPFDFRAFFSSFCRTFSSSSLFYLKENFPSSAISNSETFLSLAFSNQHFATADRELSTKHENSAFPFRHQFRFSTSRWVCVEGKSGQHEKEGKTCLAVVAAWQQQKGEKIGTRDVKKGGFVSIGKSIELKKEEGLKVEKPVERLFDFIDLRLGRKLVIHRHVFKFLLQFWSLKLIVRVVTFQIFSKVLNLNESITHYTIKT